MTLLVALKGNDGLVLAADSRGTFGDPRGITAQNDSQQKANVLAPHVAVLQAGAGEIGTLIVREVTSLIEGQNMDGVTAAMNVLRDRARQSYQEWFPSLDAIPAPQLVATGQAASRPDLAFVIGGYEPIVEGVDPTPAIYHLLSGLDYAPMLADYGFAVQGVAQYALYLLNRLYEPDRTVQELSALAVYVITETASQDGKVGGPVQVITVKPEEGCEVLAPESVSEIATGNEERSRALRNSFYERTEG
jgi:20S proteasome alpha/beta subunit